MNNKSPKKKKKGERRFVLIPLDKYLGERIKAKVVLIFLGVECGQYHVATGNLNHLLTYRPGDLYKSISCAYLFNKRAVLFI